jgi:phage protein D
MLATNLERMRMREALGGLSSMELAFVDSIATDSGCDFAANSGSPLQLGAGVRVFAGAATTGAGEIFDGQVTAIECEICQGAPPLFTVLAEDRLFPARRRRRTRLFEAMSLGDVVGELASDFGLTPEVREGVDTTARDWMQADETDLAFLRRILGRFDCDMQVVADRLQVGRVGMDQRSLVTLTMGDTILAARITADVAEQVSTIRKASFDPATGEAVESEEDSTGFGPGEGRSGPEILEEKFSTVAMHCGRSGPLNDGDAALLARIEGEKRARSFVQLDCTARGDPGLRVGSWVQVDGVNPMFAIQFSIRQAVHRWVQEVGFRTDFLAECAYLKEAL